MPFPCFDGVRAIAALAVIVFHAAFFSTRFATLGGSFFWNLNAGVWVFFVTSGFLLYRPYAAAHFAGASPVALGAYLSRRAARIYPAYWVALAFFTIVIPRATIVGTKGFLLHATLTQGYSQNTLLSGLPVAWSLVVEVSFYAFLPLYAAAISRLGRRWSPTPVELAGVAVLGALGALSTIAVSLSTSPPPWLTVLPAHIHVFALGMLLAILSVNQWGPRMTAWLDRAGDAAWLWWTLALVAFLAIPVAVGIVPRQPISPRRAIGLETCRALIGVFVVVPAVLGARRGGGIRRFLRTPTLTFLGLVSYGLYLWHYFIFVSLQSDWLRWRQGSGNWLTLLLVAFPPILAAAAGSWYLVERPATRLAHRVPR